MRLSYNWLRELLPELHVSPEELAVRLTGGGLEVESVKRFGAGLERVVVVEVRGTEPHPERKNLRLVTVNRGSGHEQRVVCGAANVPEAGGLVVLAPLGAVLPGTTEPLQARDIGGVRSEGMLCSEVELGLAEASEGILILPPGSAEPGAALPVAFPGASDVIFEIGVTPNRPDALGHVGLAREAAALFELCFQLPDVGSPKRELAEDASAFISVDNQDFERCPHYAAAVVSDVQVGPSPAWLRWRLSALGIRPISNVVDITNWLLLEYGQPLHAFDLAEVRGQRIVVRRARAAEPFTTLDGVARRLDPDDLVICDAEAPSALAGIMGGANSEIRPHSTRVLLECAYFQPGGVRRAARRHGLHTESSFRFERGVDWARVPAVLERAKVLLTELAGGSAARGAVHAKSALDVPNMRLRSQRLDALLGVAVPFGEARSILSRLGFEVTKASSDEQSLEVRGASHRPDVAHEADLVEEVARVRGLDRIPALLPAIKPQAPRSTGKLERELAREAASLGLSEAVTYAFVAPKELEAIGAPPATVTLANPLSEERSVMRTSLLPGLLEALARARRRGERAVRLFSIGSRYLPRQAVDSGSGRTRSPSDPIWLPDELRSFAAVLAGPRPAYLTKAEEVDVYDAKGVACELIERLTGIAAEVRAASAESLAHLHPRGAAELYAGDLRLGSLGPLHPDVVGRLELEGAAQVIELDLAALARAGKRTPRFKPIPRLPAVTRDISLTVSEAVHVGEIARVLREAAGELCESVELFDQFRGGQVPDGQRSLAFRLVYRDPLAALEPERARTLTDKEVDASHASVVRAASERLGGTQRA
ncbi:MAG TPA: phenylalanine--tRNA ligase subunit beta [Polyangiaceae bacterium]|nr:phenylalanine--tRNA ligase subunit beta [Polyangiaceae bacterium]